MTNFIIGAIFGIAVFLLCVYIIGKIEERRTGKITTAEYDFFWKTFCKINKEAALYEKIYQYLRDNYNRDFDIEGTIELTDDEAKLLYKWLANRTLCVLSSSNLYNLISIEMISDNRYNVTFTKVNV